MLKKSFIVFLTVFVFVLSGCESEEQGAGEPEAKKLSAAASGAPAGESTDEGAITVPDKDTAGNVIKKGEDIAVLETSKGRIVFRFFKDEAPGHVENFKKLADSGFYDGLTFHRVLDGFMVQGGCPKGDGTGGPGWTIDAEFNDRKHLNGTVSMARAADPDSAGSQFFICLGPQPFLDGKYTVFGQVAEGLDVLHSIQKINPQKPDPGIKPDVMEKVYIIKKD
ncbi:MAG: peptidylprolyl isomerase [Candidatus Goldiibacteriota bacterium]